MNRSEWERGYTIARIWGCDDDECNCTQPVIERVTPNREAGYPFIQRECLWSGTFATGYDEDRPTYESLVQELREACKAYGGVVWHVAE